MTRSLSLRGAKRELSARKEGKKSKASKTKSLLSSNFQEKSQKDQDPEDDKHSKGDPKTKPQTTLEKSPSDVNVNAVPDPVPDTGPPTTHQSGTTLIVPGSTFGAVATPGFSPLPPVVPIAVTTTMAALSHLPSITTLPHTSTAEKGAQSSQTPKHPSTAVIALLSVGAAFLLFGVFVAFRLCRRPRKRACPTPSLPILQDGYADVAADGDEESLFGGKERTSGGPGDQDLWTWTQYSQPSLNKPEPALSGPRSPLGLDATSAKVEPSKRKSRGFEEKETYPFGIGSVATIESAPRSHQPAIQQVQTALTRAANRVSTLSMSIYPTSPDVAGVGIAVGCGSPLTGDGMPGLKRSPSKTASRRMSRQNRKSTLNLATTERDNGTRNTGYTYDEGFTDVYNGADVSSPVQAPCDASLAKSSSVKGRARVKGPYAAGQLPHTSVIASNTTSSVYNNPFEELQYVLPPLSPALKSSERRERDTKALANALGLASPQPTLYPDDSITLAGDRHTQFGYNHARSRSEVLTPTLEASARLGHLMLAEFASSTSIDFTADPPPRDPGLSRSQSGRNRTDDKPPRVPSPPPLPSLAQMALAHTNPSDFDDYRSPTYSIYGLYEADRKSRGVSGVGY